MPGGRYELGFFTGAAFVAPASFIRVQLMGNASLLDQALQAASPAANISWTSQSFQFVADSALTTLSFSDVSALDDNYSFVDTVSVTPAVPEAASAWLLMLGLAGLAAARAITARAR